MGTRGRETLRAVGWAALVVGALNGGCGGEASVEGVTGAQTSALGGPTALPGRIQAEDYDTGGENVGYSDTTPGNSGGQYRQDDVDIETTTDTGGGYDVGWIAAGEWLQYTVNVATSGTYQLTARVASNVAGTKTLAVTLDGNTLGQASFTDASGWQSWNNLSIGTFPLSAGSHVLRVQMVTGGFNLNYLDVTQQTAAISLPGRVEAENYDPGGENVGYYDTTPGNTGGQYRQDDVDIETTTDTGGGYDVGWIAAGEWLQYTVNVSTSGTYAFTARVASAAAGTKTLAVTLDGTTLGQASFTDASGWQSWNSLSIGAFPLTAGSHKLRIQMVTGGFNLNYVDVAQQATALSLPGRVEAENYDPGGENVGYYDTTPGNSGGQYRQDDVDIEATTDTGGGYDVGWIAAGEWLQYTVNVAKTSTYTLTARVASNVAGTKTLAVTLDGSTLGQASFTDASGWQSWNNLPIGTFPMSAGSHELRIQMVTGGFNLNYLDVADATPLTAKLVFGHRDMTETVPNEVVANRAFYPQGVVVDRNDTQTPDRVYVWDSSNQRVLAYKSLGTCSGGTSPGLACTNNGECPGGGTCSITGTKNADLVIGQKDAFSATCNGDNTQSLPASATTLCTQAYPRAISLLESPEPASMAVDSSHALYVTDKWNHRVLKYNDPLGTGNVTANAVWGQPDFASRQCNQGLAAPTATTLCLNNETTGVHISGNQAAGGVDVSPDGSVWVTDQGNYRVLRFPANGNTANLVLGQSSFVSANWGSECGIGASSSGTQLCWPKVVRYNAATNQVFVVDWRGNDGDLNGEFRVLIYNKPTSGDFTNGMPASQVLVGSVNGTINTSLQKWHRPQGLEIPPGSTNSFWLLDSNDSRALFYTNASGSWLATKVLSQANLTDVGEINVNCPTGVNGDCNVGSPAGGMGIDSDGNIYMGEFTWQRVMRFPGNPPDAPLASGTGTPVPANAKLFPIQTTLRAFLNANQVSGANFGSINGSLLVNFPTGTTPAKQLIVLDEARALFWNGYDAASSGASADGVLYQNSLTGADPSINSTTLDGVTASPDGSKIFIGVASRIDVFAGPLTMAKSPFLQIPTDVPLRNGGMAGANVQVAGLAYDAPHDVLWIADNNGHRILRMSSATTTARVVDMVIGQRDAMTFEANRGFDITASNTCPTIQPDGFGNMTGIKLDTQGDLFVVDATHEGWQCSNNRALEFDAASLSPDPNVDFFCDATSSTCQSPKVPRRVYGPSNFTSKDANEGGPATLPNTPISVSFDASNHMLMTVDGYGNPQGNRVFFYANPVPACTSSGGCAVAPTKIFPMTASQATDSCWDTDGNLVVADQTWTRVLFFAGADVRNWMSAP